MYTIFYTFLLDIFLFQLPQTPQEWLTIEEGFRKQFPHCVGAIDGKHIVVQCPAQWFRILQL